MKTEAKAGIQVRYDVIDNIRLTTYKDRTINTAAIMLGNVNEMNAGPIIRKNIIFKKLDVTGGLSRLF